MEHWQNVDPNVTPFQQPFRQIGCLQRRLKVCFMIRSNFITDYPIVCVCECVFAYDSVVYSQLHVILHTLDKLGSHRQLVYRVQYRLLRRLQKTVDSTMSTE